MKVRLEMTNFSRFYHEWSGPLSSFVILTSSIIIVGIYLNVVMTIAMLSLVATIAVLAVHHRNDSTPVPQWLKALVQLKPKSDKVENDHSEVDGSTLRSTPTDKLELDFDTIRSDNTNNLNYDQLQTAILYGIFLELKESKKIVACATESREWKRVAERLDVIFFRLFFVVTGLTNTVMVALYVRNA